jgi:hypothetical protein
MSTYDDDPRDVLPAAVVAAIEDVVSEHPFWSYEQVAEEVRCSGHVVSAMGVAFVVGAR